MKDRTDTSPDPPGARMGSPPAVPSGAPDWGRGRYEDTAATILPAARAVVRAAALRPGERVLDVGCGTGNAALLAAGDGARVIGVDPASRLLEVAQGRAADEGWDITFLPGEAGGLPVPDASIDVALSVFAVIFAPDPAAAIAEIVRVLVPQGRVVLSAWIPDGAIWRLNEEAGEMVRKALGAPAPAAPFAWHEPDALSELFAPYAMTVTVEHHELAFTAESPAVFFEKMCMNHPLAVAGQEILDRAGQGDAARSRLLQILEDGNEDPQAFRNTSRYVVATARTASARRSSR